MAIIAGAIMRSRVGRFALSACLHHLLTPPSFLSILESLPATCTLQINWFRLVLQRPDHLAPSRKRTQLLPTACVLLLSAFFYPPFTEKIIVSPPSPLSTKRLPCGQKFPDVGVSTGSRVLTNNNLPTVCTKVFVYVSVCV